MLWRVVCQKQFKEGFILARSLRASAIVVGSHGRGSIRQLEMLDLQLGNRGRYPCLAHLFLSVIQSWKDAARIQGEPALFKRPFVEMSSGTHSRVCFCGNFKSCLFIKISHHGYQLTIWGLVPCPSFPSSCTKGPVTQCSEKRAPVRAEQSP